MLKTATNMAMLRTILLSFVFVVAGALSGIQRANADSKTPLRDSVLNKIKEMPDDTLKLKQTYILAQEYMGRVFCLELLDKGIESAIRQKHTTWELALRGSKVRWALRHHDDDRMKQFIEGQRVKAFEHEEYGNYFSQLANIVESFNNTGQYERSWQYMEKLKSELREAGSGSQEKYGIYEAIAEADFYIKRGESRKCRDTYLNALKRYKNISPTLRMAIHQGLVEACGNLKLYDEAIIHADSVKRIFDSGSEERKNLPSSRVTMIEYALKLSTIYKLKNDLPMMYNTLKEAEKYADGCSHDLMADVFMKWSEYYYQKGDYQSCWDYLEKASKYYWEMDLDEKAIQAEIKQAEPMWKMGKKEESIEFYRTMLAALDSVHNEKLDTQREYLDELSSALSEKERMARMNIIASLVFMIAGSLAIIAVIVFAVSAIYLRRRLTKNHKKAKDLLDTAKKADQAKTIFLGNITRLINEPLQSVVTVAKKVSEDEKLTAEKRVELVEGNKQQVAKLLGLVNNVLDLSRLEAGMMKYVSATTEDIVPLIDGYVDEFVKNNPNVSVQYKNTVSSFEMFVDTTRLKNILMSLLESPLDHPWYKPERLVIRMESAEEADKVRIVVKGSMFADVEKLSEAESMTNKINMYLLRDHHSDYEISDDGVITMTLSNNKQQAPEVSE